MEVPSICFHTRHWFHFSFYAEEKLRSKYFAVYYIPAASLLAAVMFDSHWYNFAFHQPSHIKVIFSKELVISLSVKMICIVQTV